MRLLVLPRYTPLAASARQRLYAYLPHLESQGFACTVSPFFDDAYLGERFASGRAAPGRVAAAFARRTRALLDGGRRRHDLAWVHCEHFPYLPPAAERLLGSGRLPYVLDYDDAIFHYYDQHRSAAVRRLLGDKMKRVLAGAARVFAGSPYLADYAAAVNPSVTLVPTVVDLVRYPPPRPAPPPGRPLSEGAPFTVAWVGSPSTSPYLEAIVPALRGMRVVLVGAAPADAAGLDAERVEWSEDAELRALAAADVGIMPVPDQPFTRGKCGFKLIQYMAAGLPVVASPVGVNAALVRPGENGFLAAAPEEWRAALVRLRDDPGLRAELGARGRKLVEKEYCLQVTAPVVARLLAEAAAAAPRPVA